MKYTRPEVQTIMFSATMGKDIEKLASVTTRKPIRISADPDNVKIFIFRKLQKNCISRL
jgi:superfamily II DNA/RNA helicase